MSKFINFSLGCVLFLSLSAFPLFVKAQDNSDLNNSEILNLDDVGAADPVHPDLSEKQNKTKNGGSIVLEKQKDLTGSYKQRRNQYGVIFSVNYEQFNPVDYVSVIQSGAYYDEAMGKPIPVLGAELGFKYNFSLGSLTALAGYGMGTKSNSGNGIDSMKVTITKLDLNYAMDNMFEEPIIVPFIQAGANQINWTERSYNGTDLQEESTNLAWNYHFKVGLSFQLNWIERSIDPSTELDGLRGSGLQNTFLDIYYTTYMEPSQISEAADSEGEPNLGSSAIGVGLKMEF